MTASAPPLKRLDEAKTIDDVLCNIDQIIDWSIEAQSTLGYFAALYKRATLAVREAIKDVKFDDPPLMEKFDVTFAQCYFNALNAYFYPQQFNGQTLSWEVAIVGHADSQAGMVQHMMTALNAHICYDLGTTAAAIAPHTLGDLQHDFNLINALVATQIPGMLDVLQERSPVFRWIRRAIPGPGEIWLIRWLLIRFRDSAWLFAIYLAMNPDGAQEKRVNQSAWAAGLGAWYLEPPKQLSLLGRIFHFIAKHEDPNVGDNIRAFAGLTNCPEKHTKPYE